MNKVNVPFNNSEYNTLKEKSLVQLADDSNIIKFLKKYHLNESIIQSHWLEFLEYKDDYKICEHCKGIESCPKANLGMQKVLSYSDQQVHLDVEVCTYGDHLNKKNAFLSHYVIRNVSDELLLTPFKNLEIVKRKQHNKNEENTLVHILKYIKQPVSTGFYIHADSDNKTKLLGSMLHDILSLNDTAAFVNLPAYIIDKKSNFNTNNNYDLDDLLHCKYLVIDGLGEENITPWSRDEILTSIISYRSLNKLPTFLTSIYNYNELSKLYTLKKDDALKVKALISKIKNMCIELMLDE